MKVILEMMNLSQGTRDTCCFISTTNNKFIPPGPWNIRTFSIFNSYGLGQIFSDILIDYRFLRSEINQYICKNGISVKIKNRECLGIFDIPWNIRGFGEIT